jgi:MFS family permease
VTAKTGERATAGPSPLRNPNFARLWLGGLVSDLGDWMLLVGLPVFVFGLTGSALTTATVFVVETVPALLVGQVAGVVVDRVDRRRILIAGTLLQAALLLPLLAVTSADGLWIVYLVAAGQSVLARICGPATLALVPSLVEPRQLASANALSAVSQNIARLVGSPLGGVAVALGGLTGIVIADALTFVAVAVLVAGIRIPAADPVAATSAANAPPAPGGRGLVAEWIDGLRTIAASARLRNTILIGAASQVAQGMFVVLFVVFVLDQLAADGGAVGLIRGVQAIGGVIGGVVIGVLGARIGARKMIGWGFIAFGLISLVTWNLAAVTTAVPVYALLFVLVGIPGVATSTGLQTLVQTLTPPTHLGRVFATFEAGAGALQAVGVLVAGALADRTGVLPILDVQALIYVGCGCVALVALREGRRTSTYASTPIGTA